MMRPPRGLLGLHDADGLLRAEKCAGEIDADDRGPLLVGEVFDRDAGSAGAGVVEEQVEAAEFFADDVEEGLHGVGLADVGDYGNALRALTGAASATVSSSCGFAAAGEDDRISGDHAEPARRRGRCRCLLL